MGVKIGGGMFFLEIKDEMLVNWSYDEKTGIYTFNMIDGTTWKYEKEYEKFHKI